ncbi:uncharacterized protein K444DRAFT_710679, partial [Hyaloscypha bicolor E]
MAKTPERKSIDSWDGSGQVWFKVAFLGDKITPKLSLAPTIAKNSSFNVPESTPNGDYIVQVRALLSIRQRRLAARSFISHAPSPYNKGWNWHPWTTRIHSCCLYERRTGPHFDTKHDANKPLASRAGSSGWLS